MKTSTQNTSKYSMKGKGTCLFTLKWLFCTHFWTIALFLWRLWFSLPCSWYPSILHCKIGKRKQKRKVNRFRTSNWLIECWWWVSFWLQVSSSIISFRRTSLRWSSKNTFCKNNRFRLSNTFWTRQMRWLSSRNLQMMTKTFRLSSATKPLKIYSRRTFPKKLNCKIKWFKLSKLALRVLKGLFQYKNFYSYL